MDTKCTHSLKKEMQKKKSQELGYQIKKKNQLKENKGKFTYMGTNNIDL